MLLVKENIHKGQPGNMRTHRTYVCYAASKLWNVCNMSVSHKELGWSSTDWYYQKKPIKRICREQFPSQTAQEVCKLLDKRRQSF